MNHDQNPNQPVGGAYRGGPIAPGPRPMSPMGPGASMSRPLGDPSRTYTPSRPNPNGTVVGNLSMSSRPYGAVAAPIAPTEKLFTGNLGRLWFAELCSTAGDVVLGAGVVIWFFQLTLDLSSVALLLIALAAPAALVNLFAGPLAGIRDTRKALGALGMLRVALALLFVAMYFHTILPIVLVLAFGLSLASNLRGALRRGAVAHGVPLRARGKLASGDQVAAGILSVAGPALAVLLYILNGERIFTISAGAAICYLLALGSESQAEPLPDKILYQRATEEEEVASVWENDEDEELSQVMKAVAQAQVWELAAPTSRRDAIADVDDGIRIAGTSSHALTALLVLPLLAAAGGALAVIEPVYVWNDLLQPPFMLGLLFTATGLGAAIASAIVVELRSASRIFLILGLIGSGVGLRMLPDIHDLNRAMVVVALIGAANVFAIRGGQMTLLRHFVPTGQRAVAAALATLKAIATVLGMAAGLALAVGAHVGHSTVFTPIGLENTMLVSGNGVLIASVVAALMLLLPNRMAREPVEALDDLPDDDEDWEDEWDDDDYDDDSAEYSRFRPARRDDSRMYDAYSAEYTAYSAEYPARGRGKRDDDEEWDDKPRRRR